MDIGKRIKNLREEYNYKLKDLAELSGLSFSYISEVELGKKKPTFDTLEKLAKGFGVSIIKLIGKDDVIINNIKLLIGDMELDKFVEDVKSKTGMDVLDIEDIESYLSGDVLPSRATLQVLADYAKVNIDFMYRENTIETLEKSKKENDISKNKEVSKEFIDLYKKIVENNIDLKAIENIIDIMIQTKKYAPFRCLFFIIFYLSDLGAFGW